PRATTAAPDGAGVRVWTSTQSVFSVRDRVAHALALPPDQVVVLAENVGGGFGPKGRTYPEEILTALAAQRLGRPVRFVATRSEDSSSTVHGHGTVFELELAAGRDGRLRGVRGAFWHDIGAYASIGAGIPNNIAAHLVSGYRLPALRVRHHAVFTNAAPTGTVRGGGRPEGNFVIERLVDALADELALPRDEVRRRNLIPAGAMPYATGLRTGPIAQVYDSGDYPQLLEETVRRLGQPAPPPDGWLAGVGLAFGVESTGFGSGEPARVRVLPDGTAELSLGSTPQGQGHETMAGQILADRLGWPLDRVRVIAGDTRHVPGGMVTAGSRSAVHVGSAVSLAATAAQQALLLRAGEALEAATGDLVLEEGVVSVRGVPGRTVTAIELLDGEPLDVMRAWVTETGTSWSASCHAAEVDVDPETGLVVVRRYVVVHDSGREINPRLVEGQLHGGIAHGIGYGLFEEALYDVDGTFRASSFLDYTIASAPEIAFAPELISRETLTGFNPEHVKGVGEAGTIPAPAAILSAIEAALRPRWPGLQLDQLPVTPERLVAAITRAR
ncbi:MAG: molybdopterin cofactor-binding domain-containing protein, partial [Candidatus Dormiibacterota bacterium]